MNNGVTPEAKDLTEALNAAQKAALRGAQELFPVGSIVQVQGRSGAWRMRVERHGCEWHDPLTVYGINTATGKKRRFYIGCDEAVVIK